MTVVKFSRAPSPSLPYRLSLQHVGDALLVLLAEDLQLAHLFLFQSLDDILLLLTRRRAENLLLPRLVL